MFTASGYAFVAFGSGWFFDNVIAAVHMRRHYFQLGLLAHLELASLLSFSSRISRVVAEYDPVRHSAEWFERAMHAIEDEYLQYIHRFHFTGASNHVQARAITALLHKHLRLREVFDDLHLELTSATEYLFNRAASRAATMTERLSLIGLFGVIGSLGIGLLSMTLIAEREGLQKTLLSVEGWVARLWGGTAVHQPESVGAVMRDGLICMLGGTPPPPPHESWVWGQVALGCFAIVPFAAVAWVGMVWLRSREISELHVGPRIGGKRRPTAIAAGFVGPLTWRGRILAAARIGSSRRHSMFETLQKMLLSWGILVPLVLGLVIFLFATARRFG